jgi:trans-aconitate 2-methyltransferase
LQFFMDCGVKLTGMPDWDPNLYLRFADQRARPAADLIAQIKLNRPAAIIDLGCGTGNSTEQLHARWPESEISGLDSSASMLAQARQNHSNWKWIQSSVESWEPEKTYDLVFSNAALHWVPGHGELFPRLLNAVAGGGAVAVQMPNNFHSPAHQAMKKVAADSRWGGRLDDASERVHIEEISFYYEVLRKAAAAVNFWQTEYLQIVEGPRAVLEWLRSTAMRGYLERLADDGERKVFEDLCLREFEKAYTPDDQGKVLFPYKRMFLIAYR